MKITKYEHACVVVEEDGKKLIIDPGVFAHSLTDFSNVIGMVVTHSHQDHFEISKVTEIIKATTGITVFTTQTVAAQLANSNANVKVVKARESQDLSPFKLSFYGSKHALIYGDMPDEDNVGVVVNQNFYYPGDSFSKPTGTPAVLAVPAHAPWMKEGEAMAYLEELKPKTTFPTHNGFLSEPGIDLVNSLLDRTTDGYGGDFKYLKPGESIEV